MKRVFAAILIYALGAWAIGGFAQARTTATPDPGTFLAIDVIVDSGAAGLGAYQVEVTPRRGTRAQLVGIEGGDNGAFEAPPAYDPAALHQTNGFDRVILAAFSTARLLPVGEARVARLHFHVDGGGGAGAEPSFDVRIVAAGGASAMSIPATAHLAPVQMDTDIHNSRDDDREGAR